MDGQTITEDPRTEEALRQQRVYERAMASLAQEKRRKEAAGYAVMAAVSSFEPAATGKGKLGRAANIAKIGCMLGAGLIPNYFFWTFVLQG